MRNSNCEYIVQYYGLDLADGFLMLYTELMAASWDVLYKRVRDAKTHIPSHIVAHVGFSVSSCVRVHALALLFECMVLQVTHGLSYLKDNLNAMHLGMSN